MNMLKFAAFGSDIELPFYTSLASHKINHDRLDDSARRLLGLYELRPGDDPITSCRMQIRGNALTSDELVCPQTGARNDLSLSHCVQGAGRLLSGGGDHQERQYY